MRSVQEGWVELRLDLARSIKAKLVVGADGAESWVRSAAGIDARSESYDQLGVVANFACERSHRNAAFQWFRRDGVLAFLPLPERRGLFTAIGLGFGGPGRVTNGFLFLSLKPHSERHRSQQEIIQSLFPQLMSIPGVLAFVINPPSLGGRAFGIGCCLRCKLGLLRTVALLV